MSKPGFPGGLGYPFRGLAHLVRTPSLWKLAALPFLVNVIVYTGLAVLLYLFVRHQVFGNWLSGWAEWLRCAVAIAAFASGIVLLAFSFTVVGNLVASPLLDFLAERVLRDVRGRPLPPRGFWLGEALCSVGRQLLKLAIFGAVQLGLLFLWLVPVVGFLHPPLAALATVYFLALEYLEYPMAADGVPFASRVAYLFRHAGACFGFGSALLAITLLPLVGYMALPACVTGAVLLYRDLGKSA